MMYLKEEARPGTTLTSDAWPGLCVMNLFDVVLPIPLGEFPQPFPYPDFRGEAVVPFQSAGVGVGDRHVTWLHAYQLPVGCEVVVWGEDAGTYQFLLQGADEVQEVFRLAATDIIDGIRGDGQTVFSLFFLRGSLHDPADSFHDIIYVGEVPAHFAVVENLDFFPRSQLIGGGEVEHIRAAGGAVDREEAQARGGNVVELAIGVGQELVALLGGGVKGHGMIHFVLRGEGHLLVAPVDRGAGGVDQMLHGIVAAGLQDVVEAHDV